MKYYRVYLSACLSDIISYAAGSENNVVELEDVSEDKLPLIMALVDELGMSIALSRSSEPEE